MYEITSWEDIRRVRPTGARFFRYRRPTGERRKFYEGGFAFPLEPEALGDRKPAHTDGVYAVHFYTAEEAAKDPDKGCPLIIQPPDCDELLVEFPKGSRPGESNEVQIIRELLNANKDLGRTAAGAADASLKLLEKASHERDLMAAEAEKSRIGPVWQLILEHHPQIKDLLVAGVPLVAAFAKNAADRMSNAGAVTAAVAEMKKQHEASIKRMQREQKATQQKMHGALQTLAQICAELRQEQKELRQILPAPPKPAPRRKKQDS